MCVENPRTRLRTRNFVEYTNECGLHALEHVHARNWETRLTTRVPSARFPQSTPPRAVAAAMTCACGRAFHGALQPNSCERTKPVGAVSGWRLLMRVGCGLCDGIARFIFRPSCVLRITPSRVTERERESERGRKRAKAKCSHNSVVASPHRSRRHWHLLRVPERSTLLVDNVRALAVLCSLCLCVRVCVLVCTL